jgi:hypothetical protein
MCIALAGCGALGGGTSLEESGPGILRAGAPRPDTAQDRVRVGSSKAEVTAALGAANVIAFDSGWEVWVYRWPGAERSRSAATELVLLFEPAGVVRKVRVRPGMPKG